MKNQYLLIFARALPYLLIVAYIAGLLWSIAIGRYNFAINGSILAVPALAAAIALLYIYRRDPDTLSESVPLFPFEQRTLVLLFGVAFSLTIILGLLCPVESLWFLGGIVVLYTIILLQIFSGDHRPTVTLIEIMLTMACLVYETTLKYPYYFGETDILPHVFISTVTYLSGHVIPPNLDAGYAYFPLYHIWVALSSHVLAIGIKPTLFLVTSPVYVVVTVFLYYLFKRVTGNVQISLLACLLYSIDSTVTFYGTYVVTRIAAYIGFAILLYLLITSNSGGNSHKKKMSHRVLAILVTVYILLVHQVSTPQILLLLLLLLGCEWFVGSEKHLQNSFFVFEVVLFLAYWFYVAFDFSNGVISARIRPDVFNVPVAIENLQPYSPFTFLFDNIAVLIFLFFAIVGVSYLFWKQKPTYAPVFGLFALLTIALYVPTPIKTLWQTMTLFNIGRLMLFISPFMAFVMGWGLYTASGYLRKRIPVRAAGSIILVLFAVYCCGAVGVITGEINPASRVSFTSEELDGFDHISSYVPHGSTIRSDFYTSRYFNQNYFSESDALGLPFYRIEAIQNFADIPSDQGFVIIPRSQFMEHGLAFIKGSELDPGGGTFHSYLPSNETISMLSNNLARRDKVYSSKFIELYHS
jgi:hypothetical protein